MTADASAGLPSTWPGGPDWDFPPCADASPTSLTAAPVPAPDGRGSAHAGGADSNGRCNTSL